GVHPSVGPSSATGGPDGRARCSGGWSVGWSSSRYGPDRGYRITAVASSSTGCPVGSGRPGAPLLGGLHTAGGAGGGPGPAPSGPAASGPASFGSRAACRPLAPGGRGAEERAAGRPAG